MAYRITFMGLTAARLANTFERETALEAWSLVQHLNDVLLKIIDPFGNEIDWRELRAAATKEAEPLA